MADIVKQILAKPIQLADQVTKAADEANSFKQDCSELKAKTERLAALLRQAARVSTDLYERPTKRIIVETEQALDGALGLVVKCGGNGLVKRVFRIIPTASFRKMSSQLENSIGDVSWLLRVSAPAEDRVDEHQGLPPIAAKDPVLGFIWEEIAILCTGSLDGRSDAAAQLVSLAQDNNRNRKMIIEEGGVGPLLKLVKEGKLEGRENAARAIGLLGGDPESVKCMVHAGVCSVFAKILKEGPMRVQAIVAWAVSELAAHYPDCQDLFAKNNIIRFLVSHLAFETVQEHCKYAIVSKATSIHQVVLGSNGNNSNAANSDANDNVVEDDERNRHLPMGNRQPYHMHSVVTTTMTMKDELKQRQQKPSDGKNQNNLAKSNGNGQNHVNHHHRHQPGVSLAGVNNKGKELEEPATKAYMKAMAARALWQLAKKNSPICRNITESRALLCFAILLEKGSKEVQHNSAMALMEITAVADEDAELRRAAFKPNSSAYKAVIDQLLNIIEKADSDLLIPCIKSIGNLARTFRAIETRMICPLVKLLRERAADISKEACIALTKFACTDNYLHLDHSKAIISAGGVKHLMQLVYFGEQIVQSYALVLLSYIAFHIPDHGALAEAEVLAVLDLASKRPYLIQDDKIKQLLEDAKGKLEPYQSREFH